MKSNHPYSCCRNKQKNKEFSVRYFLQGRSRWLFIPVGLLALIWFCIRVIPKPSRASYPCQRVAGPVAGSFLGICISWLGAALLLGKARFHFKRRAFSIALACLCAAVFAVVGMVSFAHLPSAAATATNTGTWTPTDSSDSSNRPVGVAKGIFPGRVAMARDSTASTYAGTGNWWAAQYNNQTAIDSMLQRVIRSIAGKATTAAAWDTLFRYFNIKKHGTNTTYAAGEKIVIKINLNNSGDGRIDASPQLVHALLNQLVNIVKVPQADILVYDAARKGAGPMKNVTGICQPDFPDVNYNNIVSADFVAGSIQYSKNSIVAITNPMYMAIPKQVINANYYIAMPILKRHTQPTTNWNTNYGNASISMCFKSHVGEIETPWQPDTQIHVGFRDWEHKAPCYNSLVDLESSPYLGGNTLLYILDALYTGNRYDAYPTKWLMFGNKYPCMVLASLDPVALESVGLDFLRAEWLDYGNSANWSLVANADNHLLEAASIGHPPSGTQYINKSLGSLGVHEHWNNSKDKQYTRNLSVAGKGIELVQVPRLGTAMIHGGNGIIRNNAALRIKNNQDGIGIFVPSSDSKETIMVTDMKGRSVVVARSVSGGEWYSVSNRLLGHGTLIVSVEAEGKRIAAEKISR